MEFTDHPKPKSSFYLTQQIDFLGFEINSISMTITLTNDKTKNLKLFWNILNSTIPKIRTVASLLGKITSTFPAAKFGRLHYRSSKRCKTMTLCKSNGTLMPKHTLLKRSNLTLDGGKKMWTIDIVWMTLFFPILISVLQPMHHLVVGVQ